MKRSSKPGPQPLPIYGGVPTNKRPAQRTVLHLWLTSRGVGRDTFAKQLGCNHRMVDYWCDGRCIPGLVYAFAIEKITNGGVPAAAWLGTDIGRMLWTRVEKRMRAA
jgi:hypothetical protein